MKGFLKFLLLAVVEVAIVYALGFALLLVVTWLSKLALGRALLSIINDGYASEVVAMIANAVAYFECAMLAGKLNAYKPYRVLCIVGAVFAVYSIVSGIIYSEAIIPYIIRLAISIYFFFQAKKLILE